MTYLIAVLCALLSGAGFFFSTGHGSVWLLAWLAPIPVLWLAFGPEKYWLVFAAALLAGIVGGCNILPAYFGILPAAVLAIAVAAPALSFAVSVVAARFVAQRLSPPMGILAFAVVWTALDFFASWSANGAALSPAYSQVGLPLMIQSASVFGLWVVTFVIGFFAAGVALAVATKRPAPALLALIVAVLNAGYGLWRMETAPATQSVRVGLAADDALIATGLKPDEQSALAVAKTYAAAVRTLTARGASLIVLPEKTAVLEPAWQGAFYAELETAAHIGHATVVIGVDERIAGRKNNALVFFPNGAPPRSYAKRRLVPGLESAFTPGTASLMLGDRTGIAVCKDMDFPDLLRADARLEPVIYAVPAWDFGKDGWWHARLAIMRGVENGFAVARAANDGLLTLSDAYGRVIAQKPSGADGMTLLTGNVPRGPGRTLFARVGDSFAWMCTILSALLLGLSFAAHRRPVL